MEISPPGIAARGLTLEICGGFFPDPAALPAADTGFPTSFPSVFSIEGSDFSAFFHKLIE
jgi:hypothetical protein